MSYTRLRKTREEPDIERLISALQAIAEMRADDGTNHAELTALMRTVAALALREWCCGDAACYNESSGVGCAILDADPSLGGRLQVDPAA